MATDVEQYLLVYSTTAPVVPVTVLVTSASPVVAAMVAFCAEAMVATRHRQRRMNSFIALVDVESTALASGGDGDCGADD